MRVLYFIKLLFFSYKDDYDGIMLAGDKEFIEKVSMVLNILKGKSTEGYALVKKYIGFIALGKHSGMMAYLNPPICILSKVGINDPIDYASGLVHEAYHSKLYNDFKQGLVSGANGKNCEKLGTLLVASCNTMHKKLFNN